MSKKITKYCVAVSNLNRSEIVEKLHQVGFQGHNTGYGICLIIINSGRESGKLGWVTDMEWAHKDRCKLITPSYVLEHAAELDGAKKAWEVPPAGYRLVAEGEYSMEYPKIEVMWFCSDRGWKNSLGDCGWTCSSYHFAVPEDYTFTPKEKELEVDGKMVSESTIKNALKAYFND